MMKRFNLEKALAGEPVVTRNGREVYGIVRIKTPPDGYIVGGWICSELRNGSDEAAIWTNAGSLYNDDSANDLDIFMAPKKKTIWIRLYRSSSGRFLTGVSTFDSQREAEAYAGIDAAMWEYIGAHPMEIEE